MTGRRPALTFARATVAVLALYGFLLQAFLVGALPMPPASHPGVICSPSAPGATGGDERSAGRPDGCCLAAHLPCAPAPSAAADPLARPPALALAWAEPEDRPRAAPDTHAASARGPPAV